MRILYHHRTRGDGAEGIHIREMIQAFEDLDNKVQLVCPSASRRELGISLGMTGITSKQANSVIGWLKLVSTQTVELLYNAISFSRLAWRILMEKPELIYERYSCYHFGGIAAAQIFKVPTILEVNSTYSGRFSRRRLAYPRLCLWIEKSVLKNSDLICVVSEPLKRCVIDRGVSDDQIIVTPNAINPKQRILDHRVRERIRGDLKIEDDSVVIGFVGSLRRWHGIEFLAHVIPRIVKACPNSVFLIVGTGELEPDFKAMMREGKLDKHMRFTGGIAYDRVPGFIQALDIGVMPDSNEWGSPMKILEYMLQGKPVVAPRIAPIEEIIENEKTGLLFERLDSDSFLTALSRLATDKELRKKIGVSAQSYVLTERKWSNNAAKVLDAYQCKHVG